MKWKTKTAAAFLLAATAAVLGGLLGLVASVGVTVAAELLRREDKRKKAAEPCQ